MTNRTDRKRYPLERIGLSPSAVTTIIAALVGVLVGLGAFAFKILIGFVQTRFWGTTDMSPDTLLAAPWTTRLINPIIGGLIVGPFVYYFAREAKGDGVPEVIAAVVTRNSIIRPVVVVVKSIASSISIGSGGSVGREGPIVQIGAVIASTVGQVLRLRPAQMKTLVGCGVAAGIGATFNAPIAGTLFALELIVGDFGLTSFTPIIVAAVTSTSITRYFEGNTLAFYLPHFSMVSAWELLLYVVLGLASGLAGYLFIWLLNKMDNLYEKITIPEWSKAATGGLVIGIIAFRFPHIMGVGYETIGQLFSGEFPLLLIVFLVFLKIFATSVTIGSGGSGGVFAPSLFIGAMVGGAFGTVANMLFPTTTASVGAYALVGMAAVNGACTLAPLSAIIILVELTDNYSIILPLMLTVVISSFVSRKLSHESIYTRKLVSRGIKVHFGEDVNILRTVGVHDILRHDEALISIKATFTELINVVLNKHRNVVVVVDDDNTYCGVIALQHLRHALKNPREYEQKTSIDDLIEHAPSVNIKDTLDTAFNVFSGLGFDRLPVIDDDNHLKGSILLSDIIAQYNREVINRNIAIELGAVIHSAEQPERLKLSGDVIVTEIPVPRWMVGKTIQETGLRRDYGVSIFLVNELHHRKEARMVTPSSDYVLHDGDTLLVSGKEADIDKVAKL